MFVELQDHGFPEQSVVNEVLVKAAKDLGLPLCATNDVHFAEKDDGIAQVYLERIMGLGYLDAQLKIQVHFLMLMAAGTIFTLGVGLFLWDFFRAAPLRPAALVAPAPPAVPAGPDEPHPLPAT